MADFIAGTKQKARRERRERIQAERKQRADVDGMTLPQLRAVVQYLLDEVTDLRDKIEQKS